MWKRLAVATATILLLGAECGPVDRGRLVIDGLELEPMVLPWEVIVSDEVGHGDAVLDALDMANEAFFPTVAFDGRIDQDAYEEHMDSRPEDRLGIVLVNEGFVRTPDSMSLDGQSQGDPGGSATLWWNEAGEIAAADIIISSDIAYDWQTVRDISAHEAGHTLGLDHDDSSLDLGSCMASPPEHDCRFTASDVLLVQGN